jgi:hypothetical protein
LLQKLFLLLLLGLDQLLLFELVLLAFLLLPDICFLFLLPPQLFIFIYMVTILIIIWLEVLVLGFFPFIFFLI